jgi:hypothetical protein
MYEHAVEVKMSLYFMVLVVKGKIASDDVVFEIMST